MPRISRVGISAATAGALGCRLVVAAVGGSSARSGSVTRARTAAAGAGPVRWRTMRGPGEARLLASGALLQQLAQGSGLLALLVIVTLLARRLTRRRARHLRAGGLARRLPARAPQQRGERRGARDGRRDRAETSAPACSSVAARLYALVGAGHRPADRGRGASCSPPRCSTATLAREARVGGLGLGALTAVGIAASVYLDRLRAERLFPRGGRDGDRRGGDLPRPDGHAGPRGRGPGADHRR